MKKLILGLFSFLLLSVGITSADGIYHNSQLGLISIISGGNTILTIQDKNVGAINFGEIGCTYQYGNQYCFVNGQSYPVDNSNLDLSSYAPGTYNSNGYIMYNMDAVNNNNLWGAESNSLLDQKGPCDTGYHIISTDELGLIPLDTLTIGGIGYCYLFYTYFGFGVDGKNTWINKGNFDQVNAQAFDVSDNSRCSLVGSENKYHNLPVRCSANNVVNPDGSWFKIIGDDLGGGSSSSTYDVIYNSGQIQSFTTDQSITINGYSLYNGNGSFSPYFNISYVDEDNQTLTESYDKTNLILGGKFSKTYTGGENNFWVLTALGSSTIPDIIYTGLDFTGSSNISGNVFTNFVDNGFNVIGTNIPNFIAYGFVLIILIILIRLIRKFKGAGKGRI